MPRPRALRLTVRLRSCASYSSPDPPLCPACPRLACGAGGRPPGLTRACLLRPLRPPWGRRCSCPGRPENRRQVAPVPQPSAVRRQSWASCPRAPGGSQGALLGVVRVCVTATVRVWAAGCGQEGLFPGPLPGSVVSSPLPSWQLVTPPVSPSSWQGSGLGRTPPAPRAAPAPWPPWLGPGLRGPRFLAGQGSRALASVCPCPGLLHHALEHVCGPGTRRLLPLSLWTHCSRVACSHVATAATPWTECVPTRPLTTPPPIPGPMCAPRPPSLCSAPRPAPFLSLPGSLASVHVLPSPSSPAQSTPSHGC